jgi:hypothetical protein
VGWEQEGVPAESFSQFQQFTGTIQQGKVAFYLRSLIKPPVNTADNWKTQDMRPTVFLRKAVYFRWGK